MTVMVSGRVELSPALRAQRLALVAAARARLSGQESAPTGETTAQGAVVVSPVRAGGKPAEVRRLGSTPSRETPVVIADPARTTSRRGRGRPAEILERVEFIARTHGQLSVAQQAAQLGVSYALVSKHRQELARAGRIEIRHRLSDHREWTPEEVEWFRANIGRPWNELQAHLGRSYNALIVAAKRLDTDRHLRKRNRGTLNANDVAHLLGQDIHFIDRQLIPWRLLKAKRSEWLTSGEGPQWEIRREDLVEFLIDYPWQYDRERIQDAFFRQVADEAWKRDPLYTTEQAARILGFENSHGVSSFMRQTAPKFVPRSKLILRRRGNPRNAGRAASEKGMQTYVPRSTLLAIKASGWINYRTVSADTEHPTVETAARLLYERPDRPDYITRSVLAERLRRLYRSGAVPTKVLNLGARKPWLIARSRADLEPMLPYLFARTNFSARITHHHRALLERHEPELLRDPRALALAQATGDLTHRLLDYYEQERRAEREFRLGGRKRAVFVSPQVARTLDLLGNRTRYVGRRRGAAYHLQRCLRGLVQISLKEARRHALRLCAHCDVVAKERRRGRARPEPVLVACSRCGDAFPRPVGRPAKEPRCSRCHADRHARRAA